MSKKLNQRQRVQIRIRKLQMKKPSAVVLLCAAAILLAGSILLPRLMKAPPAAKTALTGEDTPLVMDFVGDVMLDRNIRTLGEKNGYDSLFDGVRSCFRQSDLVFANLESSVVDDSDLGKYAFNDAKVRYACSYRALDSARNAGINMFSCANNHAMDYGREALRTALDYFTQAGVVYTGIGNNTAEAAVCQTKQIGDYTVAFFSVSDIYKNGTSAGAARSGVLTTGNTDYLDAVYNASAAADLTVVYVHWGEENTGSVTEEQKQIGHRLVEAGADIVIGSHPHVLQRTELYQDSIIFYSLGSFIFDQADTFCRDTVLVQFTLDEDGNGLFELVPMRSVDGVPYETDSSFYRARINRRITQGLDNSAYYVNELGHIMIPAVHVADDPFGINR